MDIKEQKLTQAVAMQVPQSAYVSIVMLDRAVRSSGHNSSQRLSTCKREVYVLVCYHCKVWKAPSEARTWMQFYIEFVKFTSINSGLGLEVLPRNWPKERGTSSHLTMREFQIRTFVKLQCLQPLISPEMISATQRCLLSWESATRRSMCGRSRGRKASLKLRNNPWKSRRREQINFFFDWL